MLDSLACSLLALMSYSLHVGTLGTIIKFINFIINNTSVENLEIFDEHWKLCN